MFFFSSLNLLFSIIVFYAQFIKLLLRIESIQKNNQNVKQGERPW